MRKNMEIIGQAQAIHKCGNELPRSKWYRTHPEGIVPGTVVRCSCGIKYVWKYFGYSETWGWDRLEGSLDWKL
jgi:hypothetical protein